MGSVGSSLVIVLLNLIGLILLGALSVTRIINSSHFKSVPAFKNRLASLTRVFSRNHSAPLNSINEDLDDAHQKAKKPPWVTRKRVKVYKGKIQEDESGRGRFALNLLEFRNSLSAETTEPTGAPVPDGFPAESDEGWNSALDSREYAPPAEITVDYNPVTEILSAPEEENARPDGFEEGDVQIIKKGRFTISDNEEELRDAVRSAQADEILAARTAPVADFPITETMPSQSEIQSPVRKGGSPGEVQQTFDFGGIEAGMTPEDKVFEEIPINHEYIVPTAFLQSSSVVDGDSWRAEIIKNSELLVTTLRDFGIESRVINVNRGPVITLYEMQIAPGIKVNRIVSLSDDIAMALAGSRVRIVAPIPGKSAIGVEVPNGHREMVSLGDVLGSREFQGSTGQLKVALGKDILGKPVMLDLKKLPHLLIAGATGSGKSVCVNSIITSLLYCYDPNFVRFIMVDPKMVELQLYNGIPHLLHPVIVDAQVAPKALKWAMYEMERRYRLLSQLNTRDIDRYNQKVKGYGTTYERLPYIVIIMDELADLMMVASKEIEGCITRIAQKSRAVGIHLVLATQRPSVDVITGVIKANFPARIAFQVAQKTDSRTIIDQNGAEKLLGKGDMLYQSPMSSFPMRIQGAFISEDEIQSIVSHLRSMGSPNYIDIDESIFEEELSDEDEGDDDELFVEALKIVEETKKASASYLQRRLSIGYNRAARIIELMEERGYIGSQQGSKPREVFV
ncbi:MAG: DNA translocase FtsK [Spirochaetes bacterium]|nr:MAG: DNA translocase FtsK [Spirochaetota bacterium]